MDDSAIAERALEYALETHPDAAVTVLTVVGGPSTMMGGATALALADDVEAAAAERAAPVFERAQRVADTRDRDLETAVELGHPAREIVEHAPDYDAIVMGAHGRHASDPARRYLVGDVAKTVFERSPVPVTSVR